MLPILLYVAQLCDPPSEVCQMVDEVMLRTWPGPFNRVNPQDLKNLRQLGFPIQHKDLATVATAAQSRVGHWDNYQSGGLQPQRRVEALRDVSHRPKQVHS